MLSGCSSLRLGYSHGPTLAYWWLDDYIDFSPQQAPRVRAALEQWFAWHRSQRLAQDLALLERARREVQSDVTPAQICAGWSQVLQWADSAYARLAPAVAEIAATLTDEQLAHLETRFAEKNRKWTREHLQADRQVRLDAQLDRVVDNAEKLYGRLERSQKLWLASQLALSVHDARQALAQRQAQQQDTLQRLRQIRAGAAALPLLRDWLERQIEPGDETARHARSAFVSERCQLTADLHNRTTPAQRRHAIDTLAGWQQDLRDFVVLPGDVPAAPAGSAAKLPAASSTSQTEAPPIRFTAPRWPAQAPAER